VLSMWIGESERNLASLFDKARHSRPCVLFFDEIDALAYSRSKAQSEHTRQVVNEFLAQLDGFGADNQGVLILAATNMPWDVDSAMKRPGRFSRSVFVPPPDPEARSRIVELKLAGVPHENIDSRAIGAATAHLHANTACPRRARYNSRPAIAASAEMSRHRSNSPAISSSAASTRAL
jgi:SpoVK/Ycf46/Vps4 family AAA+-type ATPase